MTNLPDYAFPYPETEQSSWASRGMTLRDYFAAKAMTATIQSNASMIAISKLIKRKDLPEGGSGLATGVAAIAYEYADHMLEARDK